MEAVLALSLDAYARPKPMSSRWYTVNLVSARNSQSRSPYQQYLFDFAAWEVPSGIGSQVPQARLFPFPFGPGLVVGLFLFWPAWSWGTFPFPFWAWELPQTSYSTFVGLIGCLGRYCTEVLFYVNISFRGRSNLNF